MSDPEGTLTAAQHEILQVIWNAPKSGATVTEIWQTIGAQRGIGRTTVLNQVDRLEKRGWLRREKTPDGFRYMASKDRKQATRGLAEEFVDKFFDGSASELVMSLLGSRKLNAEEIAKLRQLLESRPGTRSPKKQ
ncbi:BlaI/MecI/CopY family transcriptional regulator [Novipirellula artificiosorum]|uniref:Methicillin resistance regulatory protein MecI n=1 Tax=Novipirellula artificiosorum TaxID=2528016 RepID=A0A5C6DDT2_9BACT|nr:BlaI/MecI/CopY family transcriptional regulator [Novipirellula artificiosorum]TWU33861.1 Methicillin resistance regulatory protein MecI [Novipirellula artificiosorum]